MVVVVLKWRNNVMYSAPSLIVHWVHVLVLIMMVLLVSNEGTELCRQNLTWVLNMVTVHVTASSDLRNTIGLAVEQRCCIIRVLMLH